MSSSLTWNDQSITADYDYPTDGTIYATQTIVADGSTYPGLGGFYNFSVGAVNGNEEQITISDFTGAVPPATFNGPVFVGPSTDSPVTSVLLVNSNVSGLTASDLSFTGDSVALNLEGLNTTASTSITFDVFFGQTTINGPQYGSGTIESDTGNDLIKAFYYYNTIYANGGNDEIFAGQGNATIYAGSGSDTILLSGYGNTIVSGTGSDIISGGSGQTTITLGDGNDQLTLGGSLDKVTLGNGSDFVQGAMDHAVVTLGTGSDLVEITGSYNTITAGSTVGTDYLYAGSGGNEKITGGDGTFVVVADGGGNSNSVSLGNGNDTVVLSGANDKIILGNGNDVLSGASGNASVTIGSGTDVVMLSGYGNTINASASTGNDTIVSGAGSATITTGSGSAGITLAGYNNVVSGNGTNFIVDGSGSDTFVLAAAGQGFDTIVGFTTYYGDTLNVAAALTAAGYASGDTLANYLQVTETNGNAIISVVPGGNGGSATAIAQLDGINLTLSSLQSHLVV
jgi:Ca2+-binding RTX toxin-like protein